MTRAIEVLKPKTRVTYRYAGGKLVPGIIMKPRASELPLRGPDWFIVRLTDEHGTYTGSCHRDQLEVRS